MTDEQATEILTVGQAVDFVLAHQPAAEALTPDDAQRLAGSPARAVAAAGVHACLVDRAARRLLRAAGLPGRLGALAGGLDPSVPRQEGDRFGAGRLTKVRAQAVSGRACRAGGRAAGGARAAAGEPRRRQTGVAGRARTSSSRSERVLASIMEAIIGACYLEFGFETTAPAVVEAFLPEIADATPAPAGLQVRAAGAAGPARRGGRVRGHGGGGPAARPHVLGGGAGARPVVGEGSGRSKKDAEQAAARAAIEALRRPREDEA